MRSSPVTGIRPAGTRALLVELDSLADVTALYAALKARPLPGQVDVLAAAGTVLVRFAGRRETVAAAGFLETLELEHDAVIPDARTVTIDAVYDGADLPEVARLTGLSPDAVITAHTGTPWLGAFGGFAPGFAYLTGGDPALNVPRRGSPRTTVPTGSVALAGGYSAVYPRESPGGWQLIGRTNAPMWDLSRPHPALIRPGDHVMFRSVRELIIPSTGATSAEGNAQAADTATTPTPGTEAQGSSVSPASPSEERARCLKGGGTSLRHQGDQTWLEVTTPGLQSLIQDLGRPGYADLGVSAAGATDTRSSRQANRLVGNPPEAAVIVSLFGGLEVTAHGDVVLALSGADLPAAITAAGRNRSARDRSAPLNAPFALLSGEILSLGAPYRGVRCFLAVRGGIDVAPVLGSRSTDTLSGIGPPPLAAGVRLPVGEVSRLVPVGAPEPSALPDTFSATGPALLRITAGPRQDWFGAGAVESLTGHLWLATSESNRIGVRLETDPKDPEARPLVRVRGGELPSEGVVEGALQVPPSGLPVLFLADHPVTGGYPVIAVVVPQDVPVAAQLPPGHPVRFVFVNPDSLAPLSPETAAGMFTEGAQ